MPDKPNIYAKHNVPDHLKYFYYFNNFDPSYKDGDKYQYRKNVTITTSKVKTQYDYITNEGYIICTDNCNFTHQSLNNSINASNFMVYFYDNVVCIELSEIENPPKVNYQGAINSIGSLDVGNLTCKDGLLTSFTLVGMYIISPPVHAYYGFNSSRVDTKFEVQMVYKCDCDSGNKDQEIYIGLILYIETGENVGITLENSLYSTIFNSISKNNQISNLKNSGNGISLQELTNNASCSVGNISCGGDAISSINMEDFLPTDHDQFFSWLDIFKGQ